LRIRIRPANIRVRVPIAHEAASSGDSVSTNVWHNLSLLLSALLASLALLLFSVALWRAAFDLAWFSHFPGKVELSWWLISAALLFLLSCLCARPKRRISAIEYFYPRYRIENHLPNPYPK
jgi:hypothetical protein